MPQAVLRRMLLGSVFAELRERGSPRRPSFTHGGPISESMVSTQRARSVVPSPAIEIHVRLGRVSHGVLGPNELVAATAQAPG